MSRWINIDIKRARDGIKVTGRTQTDVQKKKKKKGQFAALQTLKVHTEYNETGAETKVSKDFSH